MLHANVRLAHLGCKPCSFAALSFLGLLCQRVFKANTVCRELSPMIECSKMVSHVVEHSIPLLARLYGTSAVVSKLVQVIGVVVISISLGPDDALVVRLIEKTLL